MNSQHSTQPPQLGEPTGAALLLDWDRASGESSRSTASRYLPYVVVISHVAAVTYWNLEASI